MNNHDPFKSPKRPWHRKKKREPDKGRHDVSFYKKTLWLKIREQKLWQNPYCEISEAYGRLEQGEHVDHIVPRSQGGSGIDPRNLMTLTRFLHGRKSGLERLKGCLVPTMQGLDGLIPVNREDIIDVIGKRTWGDRPENLMI